MAANTENMLWQHRKLMADEVARDFSVTAQSFADTFIQFVSATCGSETAAVLESRRRESCALIWAAIKATFLSSAFTEVEREKVVPLIREALVPHWRKFREDSDDFLAQVRERAGAYLRHHDPLSQLKTATGFMNELVAHLDAEAAQMLPLRTLTAMLAHRMLSDVRRLNQLKSGYSIV